MTEHQSGAACVILEMTTRIVEAYVSANTLAINEVPNLIASVHRTLSNFNTAQSGISQEMNKPAVSISKSIEDDFIICLEDGKKLKMLKRYLRSNYGMSPEEYRKKWGLSADYPMVAPNYAQRRSDFAKKIGLGRGARH